MPNAMLSVDVVPELPMNDVGQFLVRQYGRGASMAALARARKLIDQGDLKAAAEWVALAVRLDEDKDSAPQLEGVPLH